MKKLGLYIHIPFCVQKCNYCDFLSFGCGQKAMQPYFDALFSEIERKAKDMKAYLVDTVYIGGGTPSTAKNENLTALLKTLKENFNVKVDAEITIEVNPKTANKADFEEYLKAGINRLSIGIQSTHNNLLKVLGRIHTGEDFEECLKDAKSAGFKNISADLMFSLPDQTEKMWEETLLKTVSYDLSHISCYCLKIEENTPFYNMTLNLPDEETDAKMYETAVKILGENGYERYEISNFSKCGKESKHNLKYWSLNEYLGLGLGAYSSLENKRYSNTHLLEEYLKGTDKKEDLIVLSKEDKMSEFMFMGLRKTKGVRNKDFRDRFGADIEEVFSASLKKHLKSGAIIKENGTFRINEKMLYISNYILMDFV